MPMSPEDLYRRLGALIANAPPGFTDVNEFTDDSRRWVAQAGALLPTAEEAHQAALQKAERPIDLIRAAPS